MYNKRHIKNYLTCNRIPRLQLDGIYIEKEDKFKTFITKQGYEFESLVKSTYGGAVSLNDFENLSNQEQASKTKHLINLNTPIIFEAVFIYNNLICKVDVLEFKDDKFVINEIKASTTVKSEHYIDIDFQRYILSALGYEIEDINILFINKKYRLEQQLDLDLLIKKMSVKDRITKNPYITDQLLEEFKDSMDHKIPEVVIMNACANCAARNHCIPLTEKSVFDLYKVKRKEKVQLYNNDVITFKDVKKSNYKATLFNQNLLNIADKKEIMHRDKLTNFLQGITYPVFYLDFETAMSTVPRFEHAYPNQQNLFQYSLHIKRTPTASIEHFEYIIEPNNYDLDALVTEMIERLETAGTILTYNQKFEKGIIRNLSNTFPNYTTSLNSIIDRIDDLMSPFSKGYYYNTKFGSSVSIKVVLPVLFPNNDELDYKLVGDVRNGVDATITWLSMIGDSEADINYKISQLLTYCHLDTLAMVRIHEKLELIVNTNI